MFDSENDGLPAGFKGIVPLEVQAGIIGDAGEESAGWASSTHEHAARTAAPTYLGLYDALEGTSSALARADHIHPHLHLDDDLEVMWRLEEPSGVRYPSVGVFTLPEYGGTVGSNTGKVGQAAEFNGSNLLWIDDGDGSSLQQGEFNYAVCFWAYLDSVAAIQYLVCKDSTTEREYGVLYDPAGNGGSGAFQGFIRTTTPTTYVVECTDIVPATGTWYFIHYWYSHDLSQIYIRVNDGTTFSTSVNGETPNQESTSRFFIGARQAGSPTNFLSGRVDAAHWYHRNLTEYEHLLMYNDGDGNEVYPVPSLPTSLITHGGTILLPTSPSDVLVWEAPFSCEVVAVRAQRVGGTGATVNVRKNGTLEHLASDLSLVSAGSWLDGGVVQNEAYNAGDSMEVRLKSVAGSPAQVAILAQLQRT